MASMRGRGCATQSFSSPHDAVAMALQGAAPGEDAVPAGGLLAEVSGAAAEVDRAEVSLFK